MNGFHNSRPHSQLHRRDLLRLAGVGGAAWLSGAARVLDARAANASRREPAQAIIVLWLAGGPSQLETFDPHAGASIAGETKAIATSARGVELAAGLERLAEQMHHVSLLRTLASKEGDHERGAYNLKTGFRPQPALVHPTLGAVACHQLPGEGAEIPRHISLLPTTWPSWGGFLGGGYDAFGVPELAQRSDGDSMSAAPPLPDVTSRVDASRAVRRMNDLEFLEGAFAQGRARDVAKARHLETIRSAQRMMASEQLAAFDVDQEPLSLRRRYGENQFGRACLAARRLVEQGVRCVEVTLDGWDSHADNQRICRDRVSVLDPAFAALVADLSDRDLLSRTLVLCGGEFGRTPQINPLGGRDHWPHNFCYALAGGGIAGGRAIGETDPQGGSKIVGPTYTPADLHATALYALGIDPATELYAPDGRPIKLSEGRPIEGLVA